MEYSYHSLILLIGIAVAGLALVGALAVGPYGRRGLRPLLAMVTFAAALGTGFYFVTYLGLIEQRRAIETRLSELRSQALSAGSSLACLESSGQAVDAACAQKVFAAPEGLAAANSYTAALLDLMTAAARYTGPRTPQFDDAVAALGRFLQQDSLGLTANILMVREGCTAEKCPAVALFADPARLRSNIRERTFDANVARYATAWRGPAIGSPNAAATPVPGIVPVLAPTGSETRAPIPEKYVLPSAATIPPVSIMTDEPPERPAAPARSKDRPSQQPAAAPAADIPSETAPAALPAATAEKPARASQKSKASNAPLSIKPPQ